jgi:IMP cyclohydrolase
MGTGLPFCTYFGKMKGKKQMNVYETLPIKERIEGNSYVGRGIVTGKSADGKSAVFAYFIMGRSENSRNRIFVENGKDVTIYPYDESKVEDPSLIIYYPLRMTSGGMIVTNGDQTDTIKDFMEDGRSSAEALRTREFEPDDPNFTPRISSVFDFEKKAYSMSILKSEDPEGSACARYFFEYQMMPGLGHFIHTYETDGSPIPTFLGEPDRLAVPDDIDELKDSIWNDLDEANKISLYVRYVDLETGGYESRLINKYE